MRCRLAILLLLAPAALAHHLEEVGSYLHVTLGPDGASVEYTAVVSRGVGAAQLAALDADGDGAVSISERQGFLSRLAPSMAEYLSLELAGRPAPFVVEAASLELPAEGVAAGRFRVVVVLYAAWPELPTGRVAGRLVNENFRGYFGNSALWLRAAPGVRLLGHSKHPLERLPGARWRELFGAGLPPLDERRVEFEVILDPTE